MIFGQIKYLKAVVTWRMYECRLDFDPPDLLFVINSHVTLNSSNLDFGLPSIVLTGPKSTLRTIWKWTKIQFRTVWSHMINSARKFGWTKFPKRINVRYVTTSFKFLIWPKIIPPRTNIWIWWLIPISTVLHFQPNKLKLERINYYWV